MPDTIKLTLKINDEFSATLTGSDIGEVMGQMADLAGTYNEGYVGGAGFILSKAIEQSDGANTLLKAAAFAWGTHDIEAESNCGQDWILAVRDSLMVDKPHADVWTFSEAKEKIRNIAQRKDAE